MKRGGRPPLARGDVSVSVHFRLPAKQYDLSQQQARDARLPLSEWFRHVVTRACTKPAGRRAP
jgi:hypothetical protein